MTVQSRNIENFCLELDVFRHLSRIITFRSALEGEDQFCFYGNISVELRSLV